MASTITDVLPDHALAYLDAAKRITRTVRRCSGNDRRDRSKGSIEALCGARFTLGGSRGYTPSSIFGSGFWRDRPVNGS